MKTVLTSFAVSILALFVLFSSNCGTKAAKSFNVIITDQNNYMQDSKVVYMEYGIKDLTDPANNIIFPNTCTNPATMDQCNWKPSQKPDLMLCFDPCPPNPQMPADHSFQLVVCAFDKDNLVIYKGISDDTYNNDPKSVKDITVTVFEKVVPDVSCL